jgi:hypothetical protein
MEDEVELFSYLGEGSDERSPTSFRYSTGKRLSKPVRLLSEAANVDEVYAFELGTFPQATEHGHNLSLQFRGWEGDPRRQLYSFSSGHRVANDGSVNLVPRKSRVMPRPAGLVGGEYMAASCAKGLRKKFWLDHIWAPEQSLQREVFTP